MLLVRLSDAQVERLKKAFDSRGFFFGDWRIKQFVEDAVSQGIERLESTGSAPVKQPQQSVAFPDRQPYD